MISSTPKTQQFKINQNGMAGDESVIRADNSSIDQNSSLILRSGILGREIPRLTLGRIENHQGNGRELKRVLPLQAEKKWNEN
jgi:hypothetical protein